jgi:hypothetical protein
MVELDAVVGRLVAATINYVQAHTPAMQDERRPEFEAARLAAEAALSTARSEGAREAIERAAMVADEHAKDLRAYRDHHYIAKHLESVAAAIRAQGETG